MLTFKLRSNHTIDTTPTLPGFVSASVTLLILNLVWSGSDKSHHSPLPSGIHPEVSATLWLQKHGLVLLFCLVSRTSRSLLFDSSLHSALRLLLSRHFSVLPSGLFVGGAALLLLLLVQLVSPIFQDLRINRVALGLHLLAKMNLIRLA
ncbi:unnamed protein product [Protopolystoma xenopodis]|uniref:Uncharacterized protein n=1 Tax=Protopolystoma xenopodis TaxID=117903 RepID=A0A3S5FE47_9PLAT|nr:unnamed protein product [Protopolystoma xenopodis]